MTATQTEKAPLGFDIDFARRVVRDSRTELASRRQNILHAVEQGKTLDQIVAATDTKESAIRADLRVMGIDISIVSKKNKHAERNERIYELQREGLNNREIGEEVGLSSARVAEILLSMPEESAIRVSSTVIKHVDAAVEPIAIGLNDELLSAEFNLSTEEAASLRKAVKRNIRANSEILLHHLKGISESGVTLEEVAKNCGINERTIQKLVKASDVEVDGLWLLLQPRRDRATKAVELFKSGMLSSDIAREFGVSREMIRLDLLEAGISVRETKHSARAKSIAELASQGVSRKGIIDRLGLSAEQLKNSVESNNIEVAREKYKYEIHGSVQCYNAGCRCKECSAANTARAKEYKDRIRNQELPEHIHGTASGYINWGCRCGGCSQAGSANNRSKIVYPLPGEAPRKHTAWTAEEDKLVMDRTKKARDIAIELGRTVGSVNSRRASLKSK